jgi:hypothetical protein
MTVFAEVNIMLEHKMSPLLMTMECEQNSFIILFSLVLKLFEIKLVERESLCEVYSVSEVPVMSGSGKDFDLYLCRVICF